MDQALIHSEYLRRQNVYESIRAAIMNTEEDLIKRGKFQVSIIRALGLIRTTQLCNFINKCMKEKGYRMVTIKGYQYYKRTEKCEL